MTNTQPKRPRRCLLSVPGANPRMLEKAAGLDVDEVFLDLEDAVAPASKLEARGMVVEAINRHNWTPKTICVRINDVETEYCHDDIIEVVTGAGDKLDTIMLTKAKSTSDVMFVHHLLAQLEAKLGIKRRIGIECLIEEVEGIARVDEIAAASDRLEALTFGMGDYAASQKMQLASIGGSGNYPPDVWHYPRYRMIVACRANGIDPVDGPYANFRDMEGFLTECGRCLTLGMSGKWAIHPNQVADAMRIFTPDATEVARARKHEAAYAEALKEGKGAINIDGEMVDAATIRIARNVIERADLCGV